MTRLSARDDELHQPDDPSPYVTETAWYSFWTPAAEYAVHVYLRFRPNLGIASSCVYAWEPGRSIEWDAAYWKHVHGPMPTSLTRMQLLGGLRHVQREPFAGYDLSYEDRSGYGAPFGFEVAVAAVGAPAHFGGKHFDQEVRVTGRLTVDGRAFDIDCLAMRDRSWYRRGDFTLFRSAYSYAVRAPGDSFLALYAAPRDRDLLVDTLPLVGGQAVTGGVRHPFRRGLRRVTARDATTGHPLEVEVEAESDTGASLTARGRVRNAMALAANPNMLSWMGLVEWTIGPTADPVIGEDQEIWSPSIWRAFRRAS